MVISAICKPDQKLGYYGIPERSLLASILRKPNSLVDCVVGGELLNVTGVRGEALHGKNPCPGLGLRDIRWPYMVFALCCALDTAQAAPILVIHSSTITVAVASFCLLHGFF